MLAASLRHYKINFLLSIVLALVIVLRYQNVFAVLAFLPIAAVTGTPTLAPLVLQVFVGVFLSNFFLDLEYFLQAYVYDPGSPLAVGISDLITQRNWSGLASFCEVHQDEIKNPILRSSVFQVVILVLCGYLVVSRAGLLGTSFALGILLQSLYLGWQRRNKDWFWEIRASLSKTIIDGYFVVVSLALLYLLVV